MPNFICEELVFNDGKVDIVEQEFSKLWNDKIQRLEAENKDLKQENKALEYRFKKIKDMNWKRMDDLVKALSPWKKNHQDHKRILEAIGELKDENEKLKKDQVKETLKEQDMKHYSMEKLRKLAKRPEGFSEKEMEEYLAEAWWEQQLLDKEIIQLKEENEKLKKDQLKEIKIMKNKCLNSVSNLSKKIKELQEQIEQLEEDAGLDDNL